MDGPRRGTMMPNPDPLGNARSGIPIPLSTVKKQPGRLRQSVAGPQQPHLSNARQSLYPSQNLNPLLQSASKSGPSGYGRTPLRNSARRASQWTGTQSMVPPPSSLVHPVKDPRALRDKLVQQGMRNAVAAWLQETGYPGTSIKQILNSITAKDFRNMVEHFTRLLDPAFEFGEGKKFEDELIPALRKHQYPYADTIKEEWLKAPASMHSWPSLLGALHWLAELSKAKLNYLDASDDPTLQEIEQVPEVFEDPNHERALAYHFLTESYAVFLTPSDDFHEQERVMEERYVKKGDKVTSELEALRAEFEQLAQTQTKMNAVPDPIIQLTQDNGSLKSDKKKFEEILVHHHEKKKKLSSNIEVGREDIANLSLELQRQRDEQEQLSAEVRKQNLSPEEVSQMNSDHTNLNRTLDELKRRLKESGEHTRKLEVLWANRSEAVEQEIDCYNTLLAELALIPTLPPPLPQVDLRLDSNFASHRPKELVCRMSDRSVVNLKGETKQALDAVADSTRKRRRDEQDQQVNVEENIDKLKTECEKLDEEMCGLENRITHVLKQADETREAIQHEAFISDGEANKIEKELSHARTVALANGVGVQSRLQALQIAYQEQVERIERLRDETVRAIVKSSSDIAHFKEEVSNSLNHLKELAEES